jgi:hypothetical protein
MVQRGGSGAGGGPRTEWESDNGSNAEEAGTMEVVKPAELKPAAAAVRACL